MTHCTVMISEIWKYLHGVEPPLKSQRALAAAEACWRFAGCDPHPCGEEPLARWRYHFLLARQAEQIALRAEYRRLLVESERWWNFLKGPSDEAA